MVCRPLTVTVTLCAAQVIEMRQAYFAFLLDSNQEERAAELKVREHDFLQGIKLYMKGVCTVLSCPVLHRANARARADPSDLSVCLSAECDCRACRAKLRR